MHSSTTMVMLAKAHINIYLKKDTCQYKKEKKKKKKKDKTYII